MWRSASISLALSTLLMSWQAAPPTYAESQFDRQYTAPRLGTDEPRNAPGQPPGGGDEWRLQPHEWEEPVESEEICLTAFHGHAMVGRWLGRFKELAARRSGGWRSTEHLDWGGEFDIDFIAFDTMQNRLRYFSYIEKGGERWQGYDKYRTSERPFWAYLTLNREGRFWCKFPFVANELVPFTLSREMTAGGSVNYRLHGTSKSENYSFSYEVMAPQGVVQALEAIRQDKAAEVSVPPVATGPDPSFDDTSQEQWAAVSRSEQLCLHEDHLLAIVGLWPGRWSDAISSEFGGDFDLEIFASNFFTKEVHWLAYQDRQGGPGWNGQHRQKIFAEPHSSRLPKAGGEACGLSLDLDDPVTMQLYREVLETGEEAFVLRGVQEGSGRILELRASDETRRELFRSF